MQQFSLVTEKYIAFLSEVTPEYYILLVLSPDGNYGRARYELAKAKHLLRDELSLRGSHLNFKEILELIDKVADRESPPSRSSRPERR